MVFFCFFSFRLGIHKGLTGFAGIFLAALVAQSLSLISTGYTNFFTRVWDAWNMVSIWFSKTLISHGWFNSIVHFLTFYTILKYGSLNEKKNGEARLAVRRLRVESYWWFPDIQLRNFPNFLVENQRIFQMLWYIFEGPLTGHGHPSSFWKFAKMALINPCNVIQNL